MISLLLVVTAALLSQVKCQGVILSLNGTTIGDDGYVNVTDIGDGEHALLCRTDKSDCCGGPNMDEQNQGEWYFPNGDSLNIQLGINDSRFFRDRGAGVVRLNRRGNPMERGRFYCELQDSQNNLHILYANIVNVGALRISPSGTINKVSGDSLTMQCSAKFNNDSLPLNDDTTIFEWFYSPNKCLLPEGVMISSVTNNGTSYTSNLCFSQLQLSHTGLYTCRLKGNPTLATSTILTVIPNCSDAAENIDVYIIPTGEPEIGSNDYSLMCNVTGLEHLKKKNITIKYEWTKTNETLNSSSDTLSFPQLLMSDSGKYTCIVIVCPYYSHSETLKKEAVAYVVSVHDPVFTVQIHSNTVDDGSILLAGNIYNDIITCVVEGASNIISIVTFKWKRNNEPYNQMETSNTILSNLTFSPLKTSDGGNYSCEAEIISNYLNSNVNATSTKDWSLQVQIPDPISVTVTSDTANPIRPFGSNITLTCTVELSPAVDVPVTVNTVWTGPNGFMTTNTSQPVMGSTTTYTSTTMVSSFGRTQSGKYICLATVVPTHSFIIRSHSKSGTQTITVGVYLSLKGKPLTNNSTIDITSIGEMEHGLQCITDKKPCCRFGDNKFGEWYFPNNSKVPIKISASGNIYRNRGYDADLEDGSVILNLKNNVMAPTGLYCCILPDASDVNQKLCANIGFNIYILPSGDATAGSTFSLTCSLINKQSEPAIFQWFTNLFEELTPPNNDTSISIKTTSFNSKLELTPLQQELDAEYTCSAMLENSEREFSTSFVVNVLPPDIYISISADGYQVIGEELNLICTAQGYENFSDHILSYEWGFSSGDQIQLLDNTTQQTLYFKSLSLSNAGQYNCNVTITTSFLEDPIVQTNSFNLIVSAPNINVSISPDGYQNIEEDLNLTCTAVGYENLNDPILIYEWTFCDSYYSGDQILLLDNTTHQTLYFKSLSLSNAGRYTCQVTIITESFPSDYLKIENTTFDLKLNVPAPTQVTISEPENTVYVGSSLALTCTVKIPLSIDTQVTTATQWTGPDGTHITYDMNPLNVIEHEYTSTANVNMTRSGTYMCLATISSMSEFITGMQQLSNSIEITVDALPSPTNLTVSVLTPKSIALQWDQMGKSLVNMYEIRYTYTVNGCCFTDFVAMNLTVLTMPTEISHSDMTPIEEDSEYNIMITAFNTVGKSESVSIQTSTPESVPSSSPKNIVATNINSTCVEIRWSEVDCLEQNGRVMKYKVNYWMSGSDVVVTKETKFQYKIRISGLIPRNNYTFQVAGVNNIGTGPYSELIHTTAVPERIFTALGGNTIINNSIVTLSDIGSQNNEALLCFTNLSRCCKFSQTANTTALGQWYFPSNGIVLNKLLSPTSYFKSRDLSVVRLHQNNSGTDLFTTGLFSCEIPDSDDKAITIYIGIYQANDSEGILEISSLSYDSNSLSMNCISSGGPVTYLTWFKNDKLLNIDGNIYDIFSQVVDTENATYENILHSNAQVNLIGLFTCTVSNARGSASKMLMLNGIVINIDTENFVIGDNATIICQSYTPADQMQWLHNGEVVAMKDEVDKLDLSFNPVNDSIHDKVYTCNVLRNGTKEPAMQNFIVSTNVPSDPLMVSINDGGVNTAGNFFSLNCTVKKKIEGLIHSSKATWLINGHVLIDNADITISAVTSDISILNFNPLKTSHAGNYTCQGRLDTPALTYLLEQENNYVLNVNIPSPTITISHPDPPLYAGTTLSVTCNIEISSTVDTNISVAVTWLRGEEELFNDMSRVTITQTVNSSQLLNVLTLSSLNKDDNTTFTCRAQAYSHDMFIINSTVNEKAVNISVTNGSVIIEARPGEFIIGMSARLLCKIDSQIVQMEWLNDRNILLKKNMLRELELTFNPVNDSIHGNSYTCKVLRMENEEPVMQTFQVSTKVPRSGVLRVSINYNGNNKAGNRYNLNCTVQKTINGLHNSPAATWITKGESILQNDYINIIADSNETSIISFNPLKTSHAGNYSCQGSLVTPALSGQLLEENNYVLKVEIPSPTITLSHIDQPLYAGITISVTCYVNISSSVDSNVSVDITWVRGSTKLSNDTSRVLVSQIFDSLPLFSRILTLSPLNDKDNGTYTCKALAYSRDRFITNSTVHKKDIIITVSVQSPSAPSNVTVKAETPTSLNVTWSQQPDDFIKGFYIVATYTSPCDLREHFELSNNITILESSDSIREVNISGLQEYSRYSIVITAFNSAGSMSSTSKLVTTEYSVPDGPPTLLNATYINLTSITVSWKPVNCIQRNSNISSYIVEYYDRSGVSAGSPIITSTTEAVITNLNPNTEYNFTVKAVGENNLIGPPDILVARTKIPSAVTFLLNDHFYENNSIVSLSEIGSNSSALLCLTNNNTCCSGTVGNWYVPTIYGETKLMDGIRDIYQVRDRNVVRLNKRETQSTTLPSGIFRCSIPDADGHLQNIYIGVYPDAPGAGAVMTTVLTFDKNMQALLCVSTGGPPTTVTWMNNGHQLSTDTVNYIQIQEIVNASRSTYVTKLMINKPDHNEVLGNYSCTINNSRVTSNLNQSLTHEIQGITITGHESAFQYGSPASLNCTTDLAVDTIQWLDVEGTVLANDTDFYLELMTEASDARYTCIVQNIFGFQNKSVVLHLLSEQVSTPVASSVVYAVIVIMLLTVLLLVVIIVIFFLRRKRHGKLTLFSERVKRKPQSRRFVIHSSPLHEGLEDKERNDEKLEMTTFGKSDTVNYKGKVVMIDRFGKHVEKMHEDRDKQFEIEYDSISKEPQNSHAIADIVVNRLKNRFANIFPYDHCRVKLKKVAGDENSDYINASYMDGYEKPNAYIAAQGPLPNTLEDFWKMIWENRLTTVVMLTQCFEGRKKCECYWPENINCTFEAGLGIEVVLTSMTPFSEYTVRNMTVTKSTESELAPLNVVQFHFLAWPDHGVPNNCAVMLNFVRRVRKLHPYSNPCPLLVHCSAGVGRTGTFIVLDSMLERMKTEDTLNVHNFVKKLRTQRVLMVQTQAQYIFIHDALKEVIMCGQTEIPAADIRSIIGQLNLQYSPYSPLTGFEHQFQVLNQLKYVTEEDCFSSASSEHNMRKNRYSNKLPNNFNRVQLKSTASPGSDYINASFIDGYRQRRTYIATQGPLESTVCDFWRMVWEKESKCVVLLTKLQEQGEEMCCCYWPTHEGEAKSYGHITVKLLLEEHYGDCNLRKFEINEDKTGVVGVKTAFTVTQFHFMVWPEHETPPITSSLIELIGNVNKVQRGSGGRPMIVMCNDGVGRTGTFICIHAQLERLKTEGVFDFFQFIKSARMQRPGLITDSTQYALCHEVLADYLDSFDTYANFKEVM